MLCVVREELAELADRLPEWDEELNVAMDNRCQLLAPAALAFLQRLMTVPDPLQRCGALLDVHRPAGLLAQGHVAAQTMV